MVIHKGDKIEVELLTEHETLDLMRNTGPKSITTILEGGVPYRSERQAIYCNADGGYITLSFKGFMTIIEFDDDIDSVASKLTILFGKPVSVVKLDDSLTTICSIAGKLFVDFSLKLGNLEPVSVTFNALEDGNMTIFGNREEHQGAVNGTSPIIGCFRRVMEQRRSPIRADVTIIYL